MLKITFPTDTSLRVVPVGRADDMDDRSEVFRIL